MAYGFQGLKSLGVGGEQVQEPPMSLPVKKPAYDPSGYASSSTPSVSDTKGEIAQSPRDAVIAKYGYTPGQMPGVNKDVQGVQGTAFNNRDEPTKNGIRASIAPTNVAKPTQPSVKEDVRKAGYNPEQSLADLSATIDANGGDLSPEDLGTKFPEFSGKEQAVADFIATIAANPNLTPEEVKMKFPEFYETTQGEVSAGGRFGQLKQDKGEWNDNLLPTYETTNDATTTSGVLKEFGMNILKSGINLGSAVGNMALNPVDTAKTIGKLGIGTLQNIYESATGDEQDGEYAQLASQVGQYFKDRYGSEEGFQKAAYEDPVGVFSDLASIVSGGASVVAKTVGTAGKVANVAGATKVAGTLEKVAQGAGKVARIADNIDPATQIMKAGGKVVSASAKAGGKVMKEATKIPEKAYAATRKIAEGANEAYARKVTGLSQKAVDTFKSNPTRRNVEAGQLTEDGLMKEVADTIASEKSRLDETGKAYEAVRSKDTVVNVGSQLPDITDKLAKYNISVAPDGKLNFADSALESDAAGQKAIQFAYDVAKRGEIPADIFLNKRLDISNSIDWRSGVSDTANKITKEIRNSLNTAGHRDIAGLGALDETYGPQRKTWNQIAREFIDRETGTLKDSAKSKIMNMTNANKEALLAKIEQYFPDISLKVDALRTAREVDGLKGIKAGTYNKTALIAGGAKAGYELGQRILPGGGLIGAPLGAIAGFIATDPAYIIKRLKGIDAKVPEEIMKKIELKQKLAKKEAGLVKKAISDAAKQSADRKGLESKFKNYMKSQGKEKPLALPEKTTNNIGTAKNPIIGQAPKTQLVEKKSVSIPSNEKGLTQKSVAKVAKKEKASTLDTVTPKKMEMAKKETPVRLQEMNALETNDPRQELMNRIVDDEATVRRVIEEANPGKNPQQRIDEFIERAKLGKAGTDEMVKSILKKLDDDMLSGKKKVKVAEKKAPVVDAPKLDMQAKIKKLQDTKMSSVDSMALDDAISLGENGKNRVDAIYTTYFPKGDSVSNPIDMGYGKETPTKSLEAEARKYKSADEFVKSNGDPLYHGTTSKFDEFDKEYMGKATDPGVIGEGFYFTNNKKFADGYAKGDKANVINAYINTKKLFDIGELKNAGQAAKQLGMKPEDFYWTQDGKIVPKNFKVASKFGKKLQELGYDGATFERYPGSIETVVFDPKNIKTETQLRKIREEANSKGLSTKDKKNTGLKQKTGLKKNDKQLPQLQGNTQVDVIKYAEDNMDNILSKYEKENGNVINLDDFRKYIDDKGNIAANDTHKAAKMLTTEYEKRVMANVKPGDKGAIVGGGSGGGKGTAVSQLGIKDKGYRVVFDKVEGSDQIKSMLDKGMSVDYYIVIPDPGKIVSNIVGRAKSGNKPDLGEIGRTLPIRSVGLQKHIEAADVFKELQNMEEYKDKVTFYGVDNSGTKEQIKLIDVVDTIKRLEKYSEDVGSIKGHHIRKVAKRVLDSGGITKFQYDNLIKVLAPVLLIFGLGSQEDA